MRLNDLMSSTSAILFAQGAPVMGMRPVSSYPRKPLRGVAETVELEAAPVHETEEQAAHAPVGLVGIVQHAAAAQIASGAPEHEHGELFGVVVAVQHARTMHDGGIVEERAFAFLDLRHPLAEVGELRHEELVERYEILRLRVSDVVVVVADTEVCVDDGGGVVAVFHCGDPGGVRPESEQQDIVHQPPVLRKVGGNAVGGPRPVGRGQGWFPSARFPLLPGAFDAALDLVDGSEVLLKALAVGAGKFALERLGVPKHRIHDAAVVAPAFGAEQLVKGERGARFRPRRRYRRTPGDVRTVEQGVPVLKAGNRVLATQHKRGNPCAVADLACHDLVEANARVHLVLRHGGAAEHVPGLHAVDDPVVGLFVPEASEEDHPFAPRIERLEAGTQFHGRAFAFGPPVLGMKTHPGKGHQRARGRPSLGSFGQSLQGPHTIQQGKCEGRSNTAERVAAADEPVVALDVHIAGSVGVAWFGNAAGGGGGLLRGNWKRWRLWAGYTGTVRCGRARAARPTSGRRR